MREIKFRAWNDVTKEMFKYPFVLDKLGRVFFSYDGGGTVQSHLKIMQYTGLKDKNGKEIYEGDIVKFKWRSGEALGLCDYVAPKFRIRGFDYTGEETSEAAEVVGNIYENPDLLTH